MKRLSLLFGLCLTLSNLPACDDAKGEQNAAEEDDAKKDDKKKTKKDKAKEDKVLDRLTTFKRTSKESEPYEGILLNNRVHDADMAEDALGEPRPLPPTYTDVLIEDMRMVAERKLDMGKIDKPFTRAQLEQLVAHYANTDAGKIPGLRPFTHKEFITGLSEADRKRLVDELEAHLKNGFAKPVLVPEHERKK